MLRLYKHLILFSLPVLVPIFLIFISGYYIGETTPLPTIYQWQANNDEELVVFLPDWQQSDFVSYKLQGAQTSNPDILVLGSSRTAYYTQDFLTEGTLYNATVNGSSIYFHRAMFQYLLENNTIPDVLLLGIGLPTYNRAATEFDYSRVDNIGSRNTSEYVASGFRNTLNLWMTSQMPELIEQTRSDDGYIWLGNPAINEQYGILVDGSLYNPHYNPERTAERLETTNQFYEARTNRYITGTQINPEAISELTALLELAKDNGVTVIGFTQPFHPMFADRMHNNPEFAYRDIAITEIGNLFASHGFPFHLFPRITSYAGTADEFLDDWHYNQTASLKIFASIAEQSPEVLADYIDTILTLPD